MNTQYDLHDIEYRRLPYKNHLLRIMGNDNHRQVIKFSPYRLYPPGI